MSKYASGIKNYFTHTRSLLYSYLISLPLFVGYEVLIYLTQPSPQQTVRVSVDVWFRRLLFYFGPHVMTATLLIIACVGLIILYQEHAKISTLRGSYFIIMLAEAFLYALVLALLLSALVGALLQAVPSQHIIRLSILQQIALSLGAGLFEELFFRVILVSGLVFIFKLFITQQKMAYALAMILAALLFSLAHYIGALGDTFTLASFLFRFLFGLALNGIYLWRGFGTAAWTHALYDIMVFI